MFGKNNKVPVAILSCFLIAFILQGVLKISGVFIFEKALAWDIFRIIDGNRIFTIIYYSIITYICVYCLSFALTTKCYSKKWYHHIIMVIICVALTTIRELTDTIIALEYLSDCVLYIGLPIFINLTSSEDNRLFKDRSLTNIVLLISIQILLYFAYLGLCYWSSMLSSFIIVSQIRMYASSSFLIFFEMYIGLVSLMLSLNTFIKTIKRR